MSAASLIIDLVFLPILLLIPILGLRRANFPKLPLESVANSRWKQSPLPTRVLLLYRIALAVYIWLVLAYATWHKGRETLYFYTVWNWTLLGVYFTAVATVSILWIRNPTLNQPRLARVCQGLLSVIFCNAFVVDVTLWLVLYPTGDQATKKDLEGFVSVNMHALNLLYLLVELIINDIPHCKADVYYALLWPLVYGSFTWLRILLTPGARDCFVDGSDPRCRVHKEGSGVVWPYFFMDTSKWSSPLWYLALVSSVGLFYVLTIWIRQRIESLRRSDEQLLAT